MLMRFLRQLKAYLKYSDDDGHAFQTALIKVAIGIEKKTPQKPNILPKIKTARMIITGWSLTVSENIRGTRRFPSNA